MRRDGPGRKLATLAIIATVAIAALGPTRTLRAGPSPGQSTLADVRDGAAPCPTEAAHCIGLILHVAPGADGGLVQGPDWLAAQLARANALFAPLGVGFNIAEVLALDRSEAIILSRDQRNRIGRRRFTRGAVHVFIVERLGNIDATDADINGVHWRTRRGRWVMVSSKAWDLTLGHELGHFFGLPHSEVEASIMNTTSRKFPPASRAFQPDELIKMRAGLKRMLRDRSLRDRVRAPVRGR